MTRTPTLRLACAAAATACALLLPATAARAQALIDQTKVMAGNVTPGDAPGFPLTISAPGSYRLTSNLFVPAGTTGVVITSPDVTLDLNGFTIRSTNVCTQDAASKIVSCTEASDTVSHGIESKSIGRVMLRNGNVAGFRGFCVMVAGGERLQDLHARECGNVGIGGQMTQSDGVMVEGGSVTLARFAGLAISAGTVERFLAIGNGGDGIFGALLVHNTMSRNNKGIGIVHATVRGTSSRANGTDVSNVTSLGGNVKGGNVLY